MDTNGKRFQAAIFDMSGTILDDINAVWQANCAAYRAIGRESFTTLAEFKEKFRLPVPDFHRDSGVSPEEIVAVDRTFRRVYPGYATGVKLFADVPGVLRALKERGIRLGVASNIPTNFLGEHLVRFGIRDYFSAVTGQDDCAEQKPSPRPIQMTLTKLGVAAERAMYVGDMEEDILAGKRANTYTVAIARPESYHPLARLSRQNPDAFIASLKELLPLFPLD